MVAGSDKIWEKLMELSFTAAVNQRYAQQLMTEAEERAAHIDMFVVISTVLTLALAIAAYYVPKEPLINWWWTKWIRFDRMAIALAVVSATAGLWLVVSPASRDVNHYSRMLQSWSDLRQDVDSTIADADAEENAGIDQAYLERRFRDLLAKKNALNAREPKMDQQLLGELQTLEENARAALPEKPKSG
jgi:hypothetical protein